MDRRGAGTARARLMAPQAVEVFVLPRAQFTNLEQRLVSHYLETEQLLTYLREPKR